MRLDRLFIALAVVMVIAAGCGDDDNGGGDAGGQATTTDGPAEEAPTTAPADPALTVTPDAGLAGGDTVAVEGSGFSPNAALVIAQCLDVEDPDNAVTTTGAECDLQARTPIEADAAGRVTAEYTVSAGPFGPGQVSCDATHDCVLAADESGAEPGSLGAVAKLVFA